MLLKIVKNYKLKMMLEKIQKPKKILLIITQSEFGGAQRFLANLLTALDKNKYDLMVGAGPEGDDESGLLSFLEERTIPTNHLKYLRRNINLFFDFFGLLEICKLIKKEKPDILFLCSSKAGFLGSIAGRLMKVPKIIYRIGGWYFNEPTSQWKRKLFLFIEKFSAKFKDIIINNSKKEKDQAIRLKIKPRKKIITIYNGIDINKLKFYPKETAKQKLSELISKKTADSVQISPENYLVGTIANLYPAKGLEYLVKAANIAKNKKIKFVVIGEGMERNKLEKLIKKYNLENRFFLVGAISEAYKYLKAFDLFVLSSLKEGLPWTILETMAAGVPIVATSVGGIPEVLKDKKTALLVKPKNPKDLAKAILNLISDRYLAQKLAHQARLEIEKRFALKKMTAEIEKTFTA